MSRILTDGDIAIQFLSTCYVTWLNTLDSTNIIIFESLDYSMTIASPALFGPKVFVSQQRTSSFFFRMVKGILRVRICSLLRAKWKQRLRSLADTWESWYRLKSHQANLKWYDALKTAHVCARLWVRVLWVAMERLSHRIFFCLYCTISEGIHLLIARAAQY